MKQPWFKKRGIVSLLAKVVLFFIVLKAIAGSISEFSIFINSHYLFYRFLYLGIWDLVYSSMIILYLINGYKFILVILVLLLFFSLLIRPLNVVVFDFIICCIFISMVFLEHHLERG